MGQVMTGDGDKQGQAVAWLGHALGLAEGQEPFPWQVELLRRLLRGDCIEALDIPTGLGKTAVIATWLVARASGANVPRRLVYVVDRRAVVDQATDVAEGLRAWVAREPTVTRALGLEGRKLPISTLRGQHVDNRAWLEDPSAPAIIIGTVDMIGSRLLFSGYGVSSKMRPFQAGLLGVDALIVLDEAHLSAPFERLLEQIASGVDAAGRSLRLDPTLGDVVPQFRCLSLSATGRERDATRVLRLTEADRRPGGVVAKRLDGVKRLAVRSAVSDKELPEALAAEAWALADEGKAASRTIVFCTSRDHAQKVQEALRKLAKGQDGAPPTLFVGGRRVYERELAASRLRELGFLAGSSARPERATFVIATAAGEVGVDLDADHAVCDLVAWERMVQRLGRVNRRGERDAQVIVVPYESPDEAEEGRRGAVRALLAELPERGGVDVSLAALTALKERAASDPRVRDLMTRATTPAPLHPPLDDVPRGAHRTARGRAVDPGMARRRGAADDAGVAALPADHGGGRRLVPSRARGLPRRRRSAPCGEARDGDVARHRVAGEAAPGSRIEGPHGRRHAREHGRRRGRARPEGQARGARSWRRPRDVG